MDNTKAGNDKPAGRLLRKPRAPKPLPPLTTTPPSQPPSQAVHAANPQYAFYPTDRDDFYTPTHSVSPPPPTETQSRPPSQKHGRSGISTKRMHHRPEDNRYMLDQSYREKTSLGTYVEGQTLVKPYRPRGPAALPYRLPKHNPPLLLEYLDEDEARYYQPPEFTLQDFMIKMSEEESVPLEQVQTVVLSRHTYKKLQKLLAEQNKPQCTDLNTVNIQFDVEDHQVSPRVPHQQLLLEMAALVKEQMSSVVNADMKSVIRSLPRFSPSHRLDEIHPHTEILLYEDHSKEQRRLMSALKQNSELPGRESIFHGGQPKFFQGSMRSTSPFAVPDDEMISPSELAVLDSLMSGGQALSLKAHFISHLPDMEPLTKTLTYINLSFNDFRYVPLEVLDITQLTVLKLRNNPIKDIPAEISRLQNLQVLVFSFCLVTTLPVSLFSLKKLEHLDFAYNKVDYIPQDIRKLKQLRELNVEGNQLCGMPAGSLRLENLTYLRVKNNYMHPLFWSQASSNQPQRLMDICAVMIKQTGLDRQYSNLPEHLTDFLHQHTRCDLCRGPLYGPGLKTIRPVSKIFGIKNLPFVFNCCTQYCLELFSGNSDSLMDMLYGHSSRGCSAKK